MGVSIQLVDNGPSDWVKFILKLKSFFELLKNNKLVGKQVGSK